MAPAKCFHVRRGLATLENSPVERLKLRPQVGNRLCNRETEVILDRAAVDRSQRRIDLNKPELAVNHTQTDGRRHQQSVQQLQLLGRHEGHQDSLSAQAPTQSSSCFALCRSASSPRARTKRSSVTVSTCIGTLIGRAATTV